jgi:hypothetical protein
MPRDKSGEIILVIGIAGIGIAPLGRRACFTMTVNAAMTLAFDGCASLEELNKPKDDDVVPDRRTRQAELPVVCSRT